MIRVTIDVVPDGDETKRRTVATATVVDVGGEPCTCEIAIAAGGWDGRGRGWTASARFQSLPADGRVARVAAGLYAIMLERAPL